MGNIIRRVLAGIWVAALAALSPAGSSGAGQLAEQEKTTQAAARKTDALEKDETPTAAIRRLIPEAAGMRNADCVGLEDRPIRYGDVEDKRLTLLLFMYRPFPKELYPKLSPALAREIDAPHGPFPAPKLAAELSRSRQLGYWSMIQPDRITDVACRVDGVAAKGIVKFKVPGMYEGQVHFVARHADRGWEITEFVMPAHGWQWLRTERGAWKWLDRLGEFGDENRVKLWQSVSGKLTFQGQPVKTANLRFYHAEDPFLSGACYLEGGGEGRYKTWLFFGSYHVVLQDAEPRVPERYCTPGRSGLKIEVKKGSNVFDFHLTPK